MADLFAFTSGHPALASAFASALAGIVTLVALLATRRAANGLSALIGSFAAASLLAATLLHLLPEALSLSPDAGIYMLGGFALVYALNALTAGSETGRDAAAAAIAPLLGIGVHSFLDGALHATVFAVDLQTGLLAAPGLVLHEVAETTLLFVLLLRAGLARKPAAGLAFLGAVTTTPLGALASEGTIQAMSDTGLGAALGAVAGSLIYLSVGHLAESSKARWSPLVAFTAGVALTAALMAGPWRHADHDPHAASPAHDHHGHAH